MSSPKPTDSRSDLSRSYLSDDTIAARITGPGGAISAIRISGPGAATALEALAGAAFKAADKPRAMRLARLRGSDGRALDEALVVFFPQDSSFTGERAVELFVHGGGQVCQSVLQELRRLGCRQALPGEFSFRAVRNGRMTLEQAQAVRDLIEAPNSTAQSLALDRMGGRQERIFSERAEELRQVLALAEAGIDFSDQDLDQDSHVEVLGLDSLRRRLLPIESFLREVEGSLERGRRIQEGISIVLAGLPNAGKSTLFNELLGSDRSLTSEEAGTTRDVIREQFRLRGRDAAADELSFILHDTAGLREDAGSVEQMGISRTREAVAAADLVLFAVAPGSDGPAMAEEWARLGRPASKTLLVLTKSDVAGTDSAGIEAVLGLPAGSAVSVSAHEGTGMEELQAAIYGRGIECVGRAQGAATLTRPEQAEAVRRAREALERGRAAPGHELLAADIREALEHLSFFIGKTSVDEILGRIFSQFCIGK